MNMQVSFFNKKKKSIQLLVLWHRARLTGNELTNVCCPREEKKRNAELKLAVSLLQSQMD